MHCYCSLANGTLYTDSVNCNSKINGQLMIVLLYAGLSNFSSPYPVADGLNAEIHNVMPGSKVHATTLRTYLPVGQIKKKVWFL
jgi:hypothetical protein